MEALRDLADDFNVRDPRKLYQLARQRDLDVTQAMAFEALKADVGRQVQAPRPRALGKSAAEGPNDRLQADLSQNTRGKTKYGLVVMDVFTREAAVEPLQNKNAETVGRATKRADGGRRELRGHDRPGQRVRHAGPGAARGSRAPDEAARGPQRHCRGGPGHPDAEEGPGHARGPQGRPVERPLSADRFGLQRAAPRDGARRPGRRGEAAGHGVQGPPRQRRQVPAQQGPDKPPHQSSGGRGRFPSTDERGEELQPSVRRCAAAGRGLHDRPEHRGPGDPAEAGAAGAPGQRQRGGPTDEAGQAGSCQAAGRLPGASKAQDPPSMSQKGLMKSSANE